MSLPHSKTTIVSIAVIASIAASLLHEGLGHGVTAWLRGDVVTELTSNHLSTLREDRLVDAGGTIVNLAAGSLSLLGARWAGTRANLHYFFWFLAAVNLLLGAGYFLFSGILGMGDWGQFIAGMPQQLLLRTFMALLGASLYILFVRMIAIGVRPFAPDRGTYNIAGRLPYYSACLFMCAAGALDPGGFKLLLYSTGPAFFGGLSGLMWADAMLPRKPVSEPLLIHKSVGWWAAALVLGVVFLLTVARGITFRH